MSRQITIATASITALVGVIGTLTAAVLSYETSSGQHAFDKEKSATEFTQAQQKSVIEFIRTQRQTTYAAFWNQAGRTWASLLAASDLLQPGSPPSPTDYHKAIADFNDQRDKLSDAIVPMLLVATISVEDLADKQIRLVDRYIQRIETAEPYVLREKPLDDTYTAIELTQKDRDDYTNTAVDFSNAAHDELCPPNLVTDCWGSKTPGPS